MEATGLSRLPREGDHLLFSDAVKDDLDVANATLTACHALGPRRFSIRGKLKVDIQWKLFSTVHNLKKLARYGPRFAQGPA